MQPRAPKVNVLKKTHETVDENKMAASIVKENDEESDSFVNESNDEASDGDSDDGNDDIEKHEKSTRKHLNMNLEKRIKTTTNKRARKFSGTGNRGYEDLDLFGKYVSSKMRKLSKSLSEEAMEDVEFNILKILKKARNQDENQSP